jgi:NADH:ubiquinone oxidoreductase subunit 6 (subunit J)
MMIIINIISCWIIAFGAFKSFEWTQKHGTKFSLIMNFILLFTSIFMSLYLIKEYQNIISQPINEKLNNYETISKVVFALFLLSFNRTNR